MANTKLLKVMDYLINEQEDKARELLHQIFIEKARAIHEQMINSDMEEDMMGGDEGEHLTHDIESDLNEIDAEEHFGSGTMEAAGEDMDMEDAEEDLSDELEDEDMADMDMEDADDMADDDDEDMTQVDMDDEAEMHSAHHDDESEGEKIHDLEQAIAELKAEFEALKHDTEGTEHAEHEADVEESWESHTDDLDEDYDDLSENMDLDTVQAAKRGEVGSGRFAPAETNTRSPVPPTQTDMMGARPVKTGQGPKASGYDRQSAPDSKSMGFSNRRKDATAGMSTVSKEGDASAMLTKGTSAGYGAVNTKSPISGSK
jgi:hypothetical protein